MSDDVLEMDNAWTEYGLPKIWVKLAHVYTTDTRLSSSSPPSAFGEPGNEATSFKEAARLSTPKLLPQHLKKLIKEKTSQYYH